MDTQLIDIILLVIVFVFFLYTWIRLGLIQKGLRGVNRQIKKLLELVSELRGRF